MIHFSLLNDTQDCILQKSWRYRLQKLSEVATMTELKQTKNNVTV